MSSASEHGPPHDASTAPLEEPEAADDSDAVDRACAAHPDLAMHIRAAVRALRLAAGDHPAGDRAAGDQSAGRAPDAVDGLRFGRLQIGARLGRGGMGDVYRARDPMLDRDIAVKLLPASLATTPSGVERFRREARALARIHHPGIVAIHDVGEIDGTPWFTMDLVEGESLHDILGRLAGANPAMLRAADLLPHRTPSSVPSGSEAMSHVEAVTRMMAKLADALEHAHRAGVVHRDVKPGNIMVDSAGEPHLVDFGLAHSDDAARVTRTGEGPGTPAYMAPEQISGRGDIGPRTDVYALGVTLYEALTLRHPFMGETTGRVLSAVLFGDPLPPRRFNPRIPRDLEVVCLTAIERDPARRFPSAAAFRADLQALLDLQPIRARPAGRMRQVVRSIRRHPIWSSLALAMALAGVVSLLALREQSRAQARDLLSQARELLVDDSGVARRLVERAMALEPGSTDALELLDAVQGARRRSIAEAETAIATCQRTVRELEEARAKAALLKDSVLHHGPPMPGPLEWPQQEELVQALMVIADEQLLAASIALSRAERHDPGAGWLRRCRADLYMARWRVVKDDEASPMAEAHRAKVEQADEEGRYRIEIEGRGVLEALGSPAGAVVHLFRYQLLSRLQPGQEPRLVPVPFRRAETRGDPTSEHVPVAPGDVVLVTNAIVPGCGAEVAMIRPGDIVTRITGVAVRDAVFVVEVDPAGLAARHGVRQLDRLVDVAGRPVREEHDAEQAHLSLTASPYEVVFARADQALRLTASRGSSIGADLGIRLGNAAEACMAEAVDWAVHLDVTSETGGGSVVVPPGVRIGIVGVLTGYPLAFSPDSVAGTLPRFELGIRPGSYLAVVRHPDREDLRLPLLMPRGGRVTLNADMLPTGATPPGFVYVAPGPAILGGDPEATSPAPRVVVDLPGYFIARTEVTVAQYAEFLDDPGIVAEIALAAASGRSILVPRERDDVLRWPRGDDGRIVPTDDPRCPVHDISGADGHVYVAWRNRRAGQLQEPWVYALPNAAQWEKAARGADGRWYPWGNAFSWAFCKGWASRPTSSAASEPVLRFVADESPHGVRDLAGGVIEWLAFRSPDNVQGWRGGGWQVGEPQFYRAASNNDGDLNRVGRNDGFRLLAWRRDDPAGNAGGSARRR